MNWYRRKYVIFDRCNTSVNDATRCQRACEAAREYKLTMNAPLPQQQVDLSVTKNKVQLIGSVRSGYPIEGAAALGFRHACFADHRA